ncbi:MAG TPA: ribonuclease P protein component [Actinomycetota bacterium]
MKRIHRLPSSAAFRKVFSEGIRAQDRAVACFALATGEQRPPRLGIAASRKVGGAVGRNRAKRRLRGAARAMIASLPAGMDVVLVAGPRVVEEPFEQLSSDVRSAIARAGGVTC